MLNDRHLKRISNDSLCHFTSQVGMKFTKKVHNIVFIEERQAINQP